MGRQHFKKNTSLKLLLLKYIYLDTGMFRYFYLVTRQKKKVVQCTKTILSRNKTKKEGSTVH